MPAYPGKWDAFHPPCHIWRIEPEINNDWADLALTIFGVVHNGPDGVVSGAWERKWSKRE